MYEGYTRPNHQTLWEHEAIVREIVLEQGPIHIADLAWHRVLSPPEHFHQWPYPAITAVRKPDLEDYVVLVTKAATLIGHPRHIRILGFDSAEARVMGLDLENPQPQQQLTPYDISYRLQYLERGAYFCFYVTPDGYLTDTQPPLESYIQIPDDQEGELMVRALAAWRSTPQAAIPTQGRGRLVPAGDLRPFLPYSRT